MTLIDKLTLTIILIFANYLFAFQTDAYSSVYRRLKYKFYKADIESVDFDKFILWYAVLALFIFFALLFSAPFGISRKWILYALAIFSFYTLVSHYLNSRTFLLSKSATYLWGAATVVIIVFTIKLYSYDMLITAQSTWFNGMLSVDNMLPFIFLQGLITTEAAVISPLFDTWLSSDRPPLLASMALPYLSWLTVVGDFGLMPHSPLWFINLYFVIAVNLSCLVIFGMFALAKHFDPKLKKLTIVFLLICTPFVFINLTYTWPKMLACYFTLLAISYHFENKPKSVAICCVLSFLCHGNAFYVVFAIVLFQMNNLMLHLRMLPIYLALLFPWEMYKRFIDPPGDRLIKYQIADVQDVTSDGPLTAIMKSYQALSLDTYLANKANNFLHLFPGNKVELGWAQFFHLFPIIFLPVLFFCLRAISKPSSVIWTREASIFCKILLLSLGFSVLLQFGGLHSVSSVPSYSYAGVLGLLLLLWTGVRNSSVDALLFAASVVNLFISTNRFVGTNGDNFVFSYNIFSIAVCSIVAFAWFDTTYLDRRCYVQLKSTIQRLMLMSRAK